MITNYKFSKFILIFKKNYIVYKMVNLIIHNSSGPKKSKTNGGSLSSTMNTWRFPHHKSKPIEKPHNLHSPLTKKTSHEIPKSTLKNSSSLIGHGAIHLLHSSIAAAAPGGPNTGRGREPARSPADVSVQAFKPGVQPVVPTGEGPGRVVQDMVRPECAAPTLHQMLQW